MFAKRILSQGKLSLQANLIASSVADVPTMPMKDTLSTLTDNVCIPMGKKDQQQKLISPSYITFLVLCKLDMDLFGA